MRKKDIIITTPGKPTLYAIGSMNPDRLGTRVWDDPRKVRYGVNYTPGYVLKFEEGGEVIALVANNHPDNLYAERKGQVPPAEAVGYTIDDYRVRQEAYRKFSSAWSKEDRAERDEALATLKQIPAGWRVVGLRTASIRMPWGDYSVELDRIVAERAANEARLQAEREAELESRRVLVRRIVALNIGLDADEVDYTVVRGRRNDYTLPAEVVEKLVDGYERLVTK